MRGDVCAAPGTGAPLTLEIGEVSWAVQMVRVTRIASDWFLHIVVIGPRTHTIFLRSEHPPHGYLVWPRLVTALRHWLGQDDARRCAFIDLYTGSDESMKDP